MTSNLDSRTVQYILGQFDAGVSPGQIFRALESSGGDFVSIHAIEECLRNNGRGQLQYQANDALYSHREPSRASYSSSANHSSSNAYAGSQAYAYYSATGSTTYADQHGSALDTTETRATMPYTSYDQQRHPGRTQTSTNNYPGTLRPTLPRDIHADQLITSAYQEGLTTRETVARLRRAGYALTATEVVACLNAQGLGTVRLIDYTPR